MGIHLIQGGTETGGGDVQHFGHQLIIWLREEEKRMKEKRRERERERERERASERERRESKRKTEGFV